MNFLAHIYLSPNNDEILVGNFIADAVKGKNYLSYPKNIQIGIQLHRAIDHFTDTHPITKISRNRLSNKYGHYRGVIIDILYDHFLAKNWELYSKIPLNLFAFNTYEILDKYNSTFPERAKKVFFYMKKNNWLLSYSSIEGIEEILVNMNKRTNNKSNMNEAVADLQQFYTNFEQDFFLFFNHLQHFTQQKTKELIKQ